MKPRSPQSAIVQLAGVTVRVHPTPPGWTVSWHESGGRRRAWRKDRADALALARARAQAISRGEQAAPPDSPFDAAALVRVKERLAPFHVHFEPVVEEWVADRLRREGGGEARPVAAVVEEFLGVKSGAASPRWVAALRHMLGRFAAAFAVPIHLVRGADLQSWLLGLKLGARSRRNYRDAVAELLRFARARRYVPADLDELAAVELAPAPPGKIQPYAPEEIQRILEHAASQAPAMVPYLALRAFSGVRYEEAGRLPAREVRLPTGYIALDASITKTSRRRLVPILPALRAWWKAFAPAPSDMASPSTSATMGPRLVNLIRAAGVVPRHNGLRDAFITYRMAEVQNAAQVAQEAGNSPQMIEQSYREVRLADGRIVTPKLARLYFASRPRVARPALRVLQKRIS